MRSKRQKSIVFNLLEMIATKPSRLLEWIFPFLISFTLCIQLVGFGGFLPYGKPMIVSGAWMMLLGIIYVLIVLSKEKRQGLTVELILPLPFLLYSLFHAFIYTPDKWHGILQLTSYLQAYALFFMAFHSINGRRDAQRMVLGLHCFILLVMAG